MYLTGLRVSNIFVFIVKHIKKLINENVTTIPLLKEGAQRFLLKLSEKGKQIIKKYHLLFIIYTLNDKQRRKPAFNYYATLKSLKPIDRTSLDK